MSVSNVNRLLKEKRAMKEEPETHVISFLIIFFYFLKSEKKSPEGLTNIVPQWNFQHLFLPQDISQRNMLYVLCSPV